MNDTISGITKWLKAHKFTYKSPKKVPAKADIEKQEEFIEGYLELVIDKPKAFKDAVCRFFDDTISVIASSVRDRINDNFQTIKPVPSG